MRFRVPDVLPPTLPLLNFWGSPPALVFMRRIGIVKSSPPTAPNYSEINNRNEKSN